MHRQKRTAFSSDDNYFACIAADEKLLIWETANERFIDCKFDSSKSNTCTSLHWISTSRIHNAPKKAKSKTFVSDSHLLAVGTAKGDILIYNVPSRNLFTHMAGRHSDAVNDMCFYVKTNSFFTCSEDKHIGIWDISSGKQISKWKTEEPITSICVLDEENLLSASKIILLWNISQQSVIKEFIGHSSEIFKIIPVKVLPCYFLSAAVNEEKISAWSLNASSTKSPVVSFVLPVPPEDMDISKISTTDKTIVMTAVSNAGHLHIFEHILNGNMNQPVYPKVSIPINTESSDIAFISTKLSSDSETCIVAYGSSKSNISFKHIKIKEVFKDCKSEKISDRFNTSIKLPVVNDVSKAEKTVNGLMTPSTSESTPKKVKKNLDPPTPRTRYSLRSSSIRPPLESELSNPSNIKPPESGVSKPRKKILEILNDEKRLTDVFLEAIQSHDSETVEEILCQSDSEFISSFVQNLPSSSLKIILDELNHRLCQKSSFVLLRWLKEILRIHLRYIMQSQDLIETSKQISTHFQSTEVSKIHQKLNGLNGLLQLQMQLCARGESDSENEEPMDL